MEEKSDDESFKSGSESEQAPVLDHYGVDENGHDVLSRVSGLEQEIQALKSRFMKGSRKTLIPEPSRQAEPGIRNPDSSSMEIQMSRMMNLCLGIRPKEIPRFSGNPGNYWGFYRAFETHIAQHATEDSSRLLYLISYCEGDARRAIEHCTILEPEDGYLEAWRILKQRYGQPHKIARSYLTELMEGAPIRTHDDNALGQLADTMTACEITLKQLKCGDELNTRTTVLAIVGRLPSFEQAKWYETASGIIRTSREPTFSELTRFVRERAEIATARSMYMPAAAPLERRHPVRRSDSSEVRMHTMLTSATQPPLPSSSRLSCGYCTENHYLDRCTNFNSCSLAERAEFVRSARLCQLCLKPRHTAEQCRSRKICGLEGCRDPHHPLLHPQSARASTSHDDRGEISYNARINCAQETKMHNRVALAVVSVVADGPKGKVTLNALLDSGSDSTLITKHAAARLGLKGCPKTLSLNTMNGRTVTEASRVEFWIKTTLPDRPQHSITAWAVPNMPKLTEFIPSEQQMKGWKHLEDVPMMVEDSPISLLIGMDNPMAHWVLESRTGRPHEPYANKTPLGWVVMGPSDTVPGAPELCIHHILGESEEGIQRQLEVLHNREFTERPTEKRGLSLEDKYALFLIESAAIKVDGHYQLPLPWKEGFSSLPSNHFVALKRLNSLKDRFARNSRMRELYTKEVEGYLASGYAEPVMHHQSEGSPGRIWYLPHHPVLHAHKPDKVRLVFDCASQVGGTSLNRQLLTGPDVVNSLVGVLLRFRRYPHIVTADVEAMFHQVRVPKEDRDALRFLWWKHGNLSEKPTTYRMTVHPFGATSSPFCAGWALKRALTDHASLPEDDMKEAHMSFYVDDCLISATSTSRLRLLATGITKALRAGGFRLTKWYSNEPGFLSEINPEDRAPKLINLDMQPFHVQRTLGVQYHMITDTIRFQIDWKEGQPTKRMMLSCIASLYDPLGFVSPAILPGRLLFRHVCKLTVFWDTELTGDIPRRWQKWTLDLCDLVNLSIPRCLTTKEGTSGPFELHCFSDASETAYGAVLYLRASELSGSFTCRFVCGKSRVAPLKEVSIPRLELTAALLAARVTTQVLEELSMVISSTTFWTDSKVVLGTIRNKTTRFQTFVANRVSAIHDLTLVSQWRFIEGKGNPADIASRGISTKDLKKSIWFSGPPFLTMIESEWPVEEQMDQCIPVEFTRKLQAQVFSSTQVRPSWIDRFSRYGSWMKLLRAVAWLKKFCRWIARRNSFDSRRRHLTQQEIRGAEVAVIKLTQHEFYQSEIFNLASTSCDQLSRSLKKTGNPLRGLQPFVHEGLLRVGGRLRWAAIPFEAKHPVILPRNHFIARLIIQHYHEANGHMGTLYVLNAIRQRYWIMQGQAAVRSVLSSCLHCRRWYSKPCYQLIAPLPTDRLRPDARPFSYTGVDYFGPLLVKRGRGTEKRYGCVFTCMTIRAVHIEVSNSLDMDSFLCAFARFVARRGSPVRMYSDNGTNFRGAEKEIRACMRGWNLGKITKRLLDHECDWAFSTPKASHRGGVWERMIGSIRRVLRSLLGSTLVDDETLTTLLVEVEKILNGRPLVRNSDDSDDYSTLTPNHLLLMEDNPATEACDRDIRSLTKRWRTVNHLANIFWQRWTKEYLPSLQTASKWLTKGRNLAEGDVVLLEDRNMHRGQWSKGVVVTAVMSADRLVREVEVRTTKGNVRRDVRHVYLLEAHDEFPSPSHDLAPRRHDVSPPLAHLAPPRHDVSPPSAHLAPPRHDVSTHLAPPRHDVSPHLVPPRHDVSPHLVPPRHDVSPPLAHLAPPRHDVSPHLAPPRHDVSHPLAHLAPPQHDVSPHLAPPRHDVSPPLAHLAPPRHDVSPPLAHLAPPQHDVSPHLASPRHDVSSHLAPPRHDVSHPLAHLAPPQHENDSPVDDIGRSRHIGTPQKDSAGSTPATTSANQTTSIDYQLP